VFIPGHLSHPDIAVLNYYDFSGWGVLNFYDFSGWGHGYIDG